MSRSSFRTALFIGASALLLAAACSTSSHTSSEPQVKYEVDECLMNGAVTGEVGNYSAEDAKATQLKQTQGTDSRTLEIDTGYVFAMAFPGAETERTLTVIVPFDRDNIVAQMEDGEKEPVISRSDLINATNLGQSLERTGEWNFPDGGETGDINGEVIVSENEVITLDLSIRCSHQTA